MSNSSILAPNELERISQYIPQVDPYEYETFVLDITPVSAPRINYKDKKLMRIPEKLIKDPERMRRRRMLEKYFQYKRDLVILAKQAKFEFVEHNMHVIFHIPMPNSWAIRKKQAKVGGPHQQKPDVDNLMKAFMDGLRYKDQDVFDIRVSKYWSERGCIEIRVFSREKK